MQSLLALGITNFLLFTNVLTGAIVGSSVARREQGAMASHWHVDQNAE